MGKGYIGKGNRDYADFTEGGWNRRFRRFRRLQRGRVTGVCCHMREVAPLRSWFVVATMLLGVGAMLGVLMPWAHGLQLNAHGVARTSLYGFAHVQGIIALAGALGLISVSVLRLSRRIGDAPYLVIGTTMCLLSLAASIWFWRAERIGDATLAKKLDTCASMFSLGLTYTE